MQKIVGRLPKWRLRWVFHYANGSRRCGGWNLHKEDDYHTRASFQTREGLECVFIQAFCNETQQIFELFKCPAHLFKRFDWVGGLCWTGKNVTGGQIIGLTIVTNNDDKATVYIDGKYSVENSKTKSLKQSVIEPGEVLVCQ